MTNAGSSDVTSMIDDATDYYTVAALLLYHLNSPPIQAVIAKEFNDPNASVEAHRRDGTSHSRSLHAALKKAYGSAEFNLRHLRLSLGVSVVSVHDEMKRRRLLDKSPTAEFFRHMRNACAHGNRFYLRAGEPKRPARFKRFRITPALNGQGPVLFDFMMAGDVLDLFEEMKTRVASP